MKMKLKVLLLGLSVAAVLPSVAQTPVYLDISKPIEERVKDALSRMTLEEKVKMTHAQSKFSSPGVLVSASLKCGLLTVLMVFAPKYCGMSGIRRDGRMIPALHILH